VTRRNRNPKSSAADLGKALKAVGVATSDADDEQVAKVSRSRSLESGRTALSQSSAIHNQEMYFPVKTRSLIYHPYADTSWTGCIVSYDTACGDNLCKTELNHAGFCKGGHDFSH
jgi:hypothetical protein